MKGPDACKRPLAFALGLLKMFPQQRKVTLESFWTEVAVGGKILRDEGRSDEATSQSSNQYFVKVSSPPTHLIFIHYKADILFFNFQGKCLYFDGCTQSDGTKLYLTFGLISSLFSFRASCLLLRKRSTSNWAPGLPLLVNKNRINWPQSTSVTCDIFLLGW